MMTLVFVIGVILTFLGASVTGAVNADNGMGVLGAAMVGVGGLLLGRALSALL